MNRFTVALVSAMAGLAAATPYAVLKYRDLPPRDPAAVNATPRPLSFEELLATIECCIVFYAVTYFVGRRVYSMAGRPEDLHAVERLSGAHMRLLRTFAGVFMISSPWLGRQAANGNPLATWLGVAVGAVMLSSGIVKCVGWGKEKLIGRNRQFPRHFDQPDDSGRFHE